MRFYPRRGPRALIGIGPHLGCYKLVIRAIPTIEAPCLIEIGRVESSKKTILSLVISESRILFTPFLCSGEELRLRNFNSTPLLAQFFFRITRVFWKLYDADVKEFCLGASCYRGVELRGIFAHRYHSVSLVSQDG